MKAEDDQRHPLVHDGTGRATRDLRALLPESAKLDKRNLAALLRFAADYAEKVAYYDEQNQKRGHMRAFLDDHAVVRVALIAADNPAGFRRAYYQARDKEKWQDTGQVLNRGLLEMARLRGHYPSETGLSLEIGTLMDELKGPIEVVVHAYRAHFSGQTEIIEALLAPLRGIFDLPDPQAVSVKGKTTLGSLKAAQEDLFEVILQNRAYLQSKADAALNQLLKNRADFPAHIGLLISFLKLFQQAQAHLNDLTRRHLEYYFSRVLGIDRADATPDRAFLLFELSTTFKQHLLASGTLFKAGKDGTDKPRFYKLEQETVLNRARVAVLKSLYRHSDLFHVAQAAASADGKGAELDSADPKWPLFGHEGHGLARLGFALSAPLLKLGGGIKIITLAISLTSPDNTHTLADRMLSRDGMAFRISVTVEKGWLELPQDKVTSYAHNNVLHVYMHLVEDQRPVAHQAEVHGGAYAPGMPVLRLELNQGPDTTYRAKQFAGFSLSQIELAVNVQDDNDIVLANDQGQLNPAKPFAPFGSSPALGAGFYIGSPHIFAKELDRLKLKLQWQDKPADLGQHYKTKEPDTTYADKPDETEFVVATDYLDKSWQPLLVQRKLFGEKTGWEVPSRPPPIGTITIKKDNPAPQQQTPWTEAEIYFNNDEFKTFGAAADLEDFDRYSSDLYRGFIRLTLTGPSFAFGHGVYPRLLTTAIIKYPKILDNYPNEPYSPLLKSLHLCYESSQTQKWQRDTDPDSLLFYHLGPFGEHAWKAGDDTELLPPTNHEGALFIGLDQAEPGTNITLFFQLAEGTADPFKESPKIEAAYLRDEQWIDLKDREILRDSTLGLSRTGLMKIALPKDAAKTSKRMGGDYCWLRLAVKQNSAAISQALTIQAQVAQVVFEDRGNDPAHYTQPLPAKTIKKPVIRDSALKTISQPLPSSAAKPKEGGPNWHRRVSERLRHKQRAVTIWDYEHLVLEQFPGVYRAKCISHTDFASELAPGSVLVILVPRLDQVNALYPYKPAVDQASLKAIHAFLVPLTSPFVALRVANPLYEEIQIEIEVVLLPGFDAGFYEQQLDMDLKQMLAPWAFGAGADLNFGGKLHRSSVLNYVEERPYVDYITTFSWIRFVDGVGVGNNPEELATTTARSIFVPHDIQKVQAQSAGGNP